VDDHILGVVREITAAGQPVTGRAVRSKSDYGTDKTLDALERLVIDGRLTKATGGPRGSHLYVVPDAQAVSSGPVPRRGGPGPDHWKANGPTGPGTSQDQSGPLEGPAWLCAKCNDSGAVCDDCYDQHFQEQLRDEGLEG